MSATDLKQRVGDFPWFRVLVYAALLLSALYLFAEFAGDVYERERFAFDTPILAWLNTHQTPLLTTSALTFSWLGNIYILGPIAAVLTYLLWRKSSRAAVFFTLSVVGALALNLLAKAFFERARPDLFEALSHATNYSFPSGHTMGATAFALALYLTVRQLYPRYHLLTATGCLLFALGVSLSRPYLQVHYPSDIVAGWALSTAWVAGLNVWYTKLYRDKLPENVHHTVSES